MDPDPPSTIALTIGAPGWRRHLADPEQVCRRALVAALAHVPAPPWLARAEISVLLADDATVRRLNAEYRGKDRATNVLSFPAFDRILARDPGRLPAGPVPLGDVALAFQTVLAEAEAEGKPLAHHVSHLLVHGCLHLLGYEHDNDEDALLMEGLERDILAQLGIPDPYAGDPIPPRAGDARASSAERHQ